MKTEKRDFPNSTIGVVCQTGTELSNRDKGVTVELHWHRGQKWPHSAEVYSTDPNGDHYVDIGLSWDGNKLVDYDGVFDLPEEVKTMLVERGALIE